MHHAALRTRCAVSLFLFFFGWGYFCVGGTYPTARCLLHVQSDTAPIRINRNNNPGFTFAIFDVESAGAYVKDNCSNYCKMDRIPHLLPRLDPRAHFHACSVNAHFGYLKALSGDW